MQIDTKRLRKKKAGVKLDFRDNGVFYGLYGKLVGKKTLAISHELIQKVGYGSHARIRSVLRRHLFSPVTLVSHCTLLIGTKMLHGDCPI